ncbi:bifunctional phosphopantothenoylcysteine decarboxylase/phosphopantothenate--cysteine ligase CoaBC [bacterium]|nr:bifunctional phosphopantothenoylcysteine decarboxylase/phosphopantothenate--cysteine ligase CoaBC [bacterium]
MESEKTLTSKPRLLLAVCGSIAAYRSVDFLRKLVDQGYDVEVLLTESAKQFVAEKSIETFLGKKVLSNDHFSDSHLGTEHIDFARRFEIILVYGATAEFMASYRGGHAHTMLHAQLLAFEGKVMLMPAMNPSMWAHPATRENQQVLAERGVEFLGPGVGAVACGEYGEGKLIDESLALERLTEVFQRDSADAGVKVLISVGAMETQVDGVRSLKNLSSGLMGLELLRALLEKGANVTLMQGMVEANVFQEIQDLKERYGFQIFQTSSPQAYSEILVRCQELVDVFVSAAAVLDFEVVGLTEKLDKSELFAADNETSELKLKIKRLPDFAGEFGRRKRNDQLLVSFSLESLKDDKALIERAIHKARSKGAELSFVNRLSEKSGPGQKMSEAWILEKKDDSPELPYSSEALGSLEKGALAKVLVDRLFQKLKNPSSISGTRVNPQL